MIVEVCFGHDMSFLSSACNGGSAFATLECFAPGRLETRQLPRGVTANTIGIQRKIKVVTEQHTMYVYHITSFQTLPSFLLGLAGRWLRNAKQLKVN